MSAATIRQVPDKASVDKDSNYGTELEAHMQNLGPNGCENWRDGQSCIREDTQLW